MRVVGVCLVRNEDVFVERALRNVVAFCDEIHVLDHLSTDETPAILRRIAAEFDHVSVRRSGDARESHRVIERFAGTETWVVGIDGDELYDPQGLAQLREQLGRGVHADVFRLKGHVLNCQQLDETAHLATGYLAPPSRPVTKLFNMAAVESWTDCLERLHDGVAVFRDGFGWRSMRYLSESAGWAEDPLRMLHMCFVQRSTRDVDSRPRRSLGETGDFRRGRLGAFDRWRRRRSLDPRVKGYTEAGTSWKREWYARGELTTRQTYPFGL